MGGAEQHHPANPATQRIELRIELPVSDALLLKEGASAVAFFDALPLESFEATGSAWSSSSQWPCSSSCWRRHSSWA